MRRRREMANPLLHPLPPRSATRFLPRPESASANCHFQKQVLPKASLNCQPYSVWSKQPLAGLFDSRILVCNGNLLAAVVHGLVRFVFRHDAFSVVFPDENSLKSPFGWYSRKFSFAFAYAQVLFRVITMELDRGKNTFFVVVAVIFVLVECEIAIRSAVNSKEVGTVPWHWKKTCLADFCLSRPSGQYLPGLRAIVVQSK